MRTGTDYAKPEPIQSLRAIFRSAAPYKIPFGTVASRLHKLTSTTSSDYDPRIAYMLSIVSAWAYADGQTLADKLVYYGFPEGTTVKQISIVNDALLVVATAYFVRSNDGRVGVLAFRGTEPANIINWLTDAGTMMRPFHGGRVHTGFYENVEAIWDHVAEAISDAVNHAHGNGNGKSKGHRLDTLYITGHSLGAAMAVIAAARFFTPDYKDWQPLIRGIYTFGQPLVGDSVFAEECAKRFGDELLYRHVYAHDIVPTVPTQDMGDYAHFGQEWASSSSDGPWTKVTHPNPRSPRIVFPAILSVGVSFLARRVTAV
jgi:hypothetical protein